MLFDYCRAQADTGAGDAVSMDLQMRGKGKKSKRDKKGKSKGKHKKGESSKNEKTKTKTRKAKTKVQNNDKAEHFAGYCLQCKDWGHMKKDYWWNENAKNGKDTAPLETPITPAEITKTEPPITGMLIQSDVGGEIRADLAQWLYSVTEKESVLNDFLIDSGAATSVSQQSLADSLGGKLKGLGVELRSATKHQFTTTSNTTICLRTRCQRGD